MPASDVPADHDPQELAEMFDDESIGEEPALHSELLAPDGGGVDEVAELVGELDEAEGPIGPEDAAIHLEG